MKKLNKTIGSFEAKTHLAALIEDVQKGDEYIITRRGKPVARLVPYSNHDTEMKTADIINRFDSIRNSIKGKVNIKDYINEGRKY
jgi:prevent-host-death family protein